MNRKFGISLRVSLLVVAVTAGIYAPHRTSAEDAGPVQAHAGTTKAHSGPGASFGPAIERKIYHSADNPNDYCLDLDSESFLQAPADVFRVLNSRHEGFDALGRRDEIIRDWMRDTGGDLLLAFTTPDVTLSLYGGLVNFRTVSFKETDAQEVLKMVNEAQEERGQSGKPMPSLSMFHRHELDLEGAFVIKTREGGIGILQVAGSTEEPRSVTVRYRMVRASSTINLSLDANGQVVFEKKVIMFGALKDMLKDRLAIDNDLRVIISTAATTQHNAILAVHAVVRDCGVTAVQFRKLLTTDVAQPEAKTSTQQCSLLMNEEQAMANVAASPKFDERVTVYRAEPISATIVEHNVDALEIVLDVGAKHGVQFGHAFNICRPESAHCVGVAKILELGPDRSIAKVVAIAKESSVESVTGFVAVCAAPHPIPNKSVIACSFSENVWQTESLENKIIKALLESSGDEFQIQIRQEPALSPGDPRANTGMPNPQTVPADKRITPVEGRLLELNPPGSITVVISVGADDGVKSGDILMVSRNGTRVGRLKVRRVHRDRSTAAVIDVVNLPVLEVGDQVTNQQHPENPQAPNQNSDAQRKQELPTGVLSGRFVYDGEPPVAKDLYPSFAELTIDKPQQPGPDGRLSGVEAVYREYLKHNIRPATTDQSLRVDKGKGVADVVIWAVSKDIPWSPPQGQTPVTIKINEASISPGTAVVIAGQPVLFENRDPVEQRVYAMFTRALNPQYHVLLKTEASHRVSFPVPEPFPARISLPHCPWATGLLFVHSNPYVATSQEDGSFRIPNLPPGEWEFQAWHERSGYISNWPKGRFTQKIISGDNSLGDIRLHPARFRASYDDDSALLRTVTIRLIENDRTLADHTVQSDSKGHVNFLTGGQIGADEQHDKTDFGTRITGTVKSLSNRQYDLDLTVSQGLPFANNDVDTQVLRTETLVIRTRITIGTESSIECGGGRYCVIRVD